MVFDVLAVMLLAAAWWQTRVAGRVPAPDLPDADRPPAAAQGALPPRRRLPRYVEQGLVELDDFLRRSEAA